MSQVNVTRTPFELQGTVSFDVANLDSIMNQIGRVTEALAGSVVSKAFGNAIKEATPAINSLIIKAFFGDDKGEGALQDITDAFTPGEKLNAALGLAQNLSSKAALKTFIAKSLLTGQAGGRGQLRDVVGSRAGGQLTRNAFFGFKKGITASSFADQTFGSYQSVSRGRGQAGSRVLSAGRTNTVRWLEMLVSPERGRIPGFRFISGKPSDPEMSASRTGYGVMRFGGSFTIKPLIPSPDVRELGIIEAMFSGNRGDRLFRKVQKLFDPIFERELDKAIAKERQRLRGRGRAAASLSTAGGGTIDIGAGGEGGRTTASLRSDFADDSPVQGTGEGGVKFEAGLQRSIDRLQKSQFADIVSVLVEDLASNLDTASTIANIKELEKLLG